MTIQEIAQKIHSKYKLSPLDAEILLSLALQKPKEHALAHPEEKLAPAQIKKFSKFAERRSAGEPVAYITGEKEFFGLGFAVNKNVLIPRPETELLVELAIKKILNAECGIPEAIIDIGTGSGNIIVSILKNLPKKIQKKTNFFAVDISKRALTIAKVNAKKHGIDKKIKFIQSSLLEYFSKKKNKFKDILVVANLPYVSQDIYKKNKINLKYEPKQALLSPEKGLAHYKKLFEEAGLLIADRRSLILEISPEQKSEIGRIIKRLLPQARIKFFKDLAGKWRAVGMEIKRRET